MSIVLSFRQCLACAFNRRASTLQTSAKTSATARELVGNMQARLVAEVAEREAEAALYSARLYESERAASDW